MSDDISAFLDRLNRVAQQHTPAAKLQKRNSTIDKLMAAAPVIEKFVADGYTDEEIVVMLRESGIEKLSVSGFRFNRRNKLRISRTNNAAESTRKSSRKSAAKSGDKSAVKTVERGASTAGSQPQHQPQQPVINPVKSAATTPQQPVEQPVKSEQQAVINPVKPKAEISAEKPNYRAGIIGSVNSI